MSRPARLLVLIALGSPFLCAMDRGQRPGDRKPRGLASAGSFVLESHASRVLARERATRAGSGGTRSERPKLSSFQPPPLAQVKAPDQGRGDAAPQASTRR